MRPIVIVLIMTCAVLSACQPAQLKFERQVKTTLERQADMAYVAYQDAWTLSKRLNSIIRLFVDEPTVSHMVAARKAWLNARETYLQTRIYRSALNSLTAATPLEDMQQFYARIEGWPIKEAAIDYVADEVDGDVGFPVVIGGRPFNLVEADAVLPVLSSTALVELQSKQKQVLTGFHVIEFLLWGQDLNQDLTANPIRDTSAGQRSLADYFSLQTQGLCRSGERVVDATVCQRRSELLVAVSDLLVDDLYNIMSAWEPEQGVFHNSLNAEPQRGLLAMLDGFAEQLRQTTLLVDPVQASQEWEESDFSDNTHRDIVQPIKGLENVYRGSYKQLDGEVFEVEGLQKLIYSLQQAELAGRFEQQLQDTAGALLMFDILANSGTPFDMQIQTKHGQDNISTAKQSLTNMAEVLGEMRAVFANAFDAS